MIQTVFTSHKIQLIDEKHCDYKCKFIINWKTILACELFERYQKENNFKRPTRLTKDEIGPKRCRACLDAFTPIKK